MGVSLPSTGIRSRIVINRCRRLFLDAGDHPAARELARTAAYPDGDGRLGTASGFSHLARLCRGVVPVPPPIPGPGTTEP